MEIGRAVIKVLGEDGCLRFFLFPMLVLSRKITNLLESFLGQVVTRALRKTNGSLNSLD